MVHGKFEGKGNLISQEDPSYKFSLEILINGVCLQALLYAFYEYYNDMDIEFRNIVLRNLFMRNIAFPRTQSPIKLLIEVNSLELLFTLDD